MARRTWWRVLVGAVGLGSALSAGSVFGEAAPTPVIPPGREAAIEALLNGGGEALPAGCRLSGASIEQALVRATYGCDAGPVSVVLRHPGGASPGAPTTASFALEISPAGTPAAFAQALVARVRAAETGWTWEMVVPRQAPPPVPEVEPAFWDPGYGDDDLGLCGHPSPAPLPGEGTASGDQGAPRPRGEELTGEAHDLYMSTDPMMRTGEYQEIFDRMSALARRVPHNLVLGRLVVACAGLASDPKRHNEIVEGFLADADAHPDDALKQFIAGVSVHYRGHQHAGTREQKRADYDRCIRYLERAKAAYPNVSRVWLYLAISYYRTGRQAEAEAAVEKALSVDPGSDADIFYSRAEIEHLKDPAKALADMKHYIAVMDENRKKGGYSAPHKDALVKHMADYFERVLRGEVAADAEDLFDPVQPNGPEGVTGPGDGGSTGGTQRGPEVHMSADAQAAFDKSHELLQQGRTEEAYQLVFGVARREPANLILTRLSVTVARSDLTPARVAAFRQEADDAPDDALKQFVAGIACHYFAHGSRSSDAERREGYLAAIGYLERASKAYPHSDRAWLYLAVSYYRTGQQAQAEATIAHAFSLSPDVADPDLFYCRAEIFHAKDLARSVADLREYRTRMERNIAGGALHSPEKEERVASMLQTLEAVLAGKATLQQGDPFLTDTVKK